MATGKKKHFDVRDFVDSDKDIDFPQLPFCNVVNKFLKEFIDTCLLMDCQVRAISLKDFYQKICKVFCAERTFDDFFLGA